MKPLYWIEAWGTCAEYDEGYGVWLENKSLGHLESTARGAKDAREEGKRLERKLKERVSGKLKNIKTYSQITRQ